MILSNKRIKMALIRLCGCAGWSAPFVVRKQPMTVFSCRGPKYDVLQSLNIVFILPNTAVSDEMLHILALIWAFTGCQSTRFGVSSIQRITYYLNRTYNASDQLATGSVWSNLEPSHVCLQMKRTFTIVHLIISF